MNQQSAEDNYSDSSFTTILGILVVVLILAIVIYKLAFSPDDLDTGYEDAHTTNNESASPPEQIPPETIKNHQSASETTPPSVDPVESSGEETMDSEQDKKEINQFIIDWKTAWQRSAGPNGNIDNYFTLYADNFTSDNLSKKAWQGSKKLRNQGKSWIEVWISDIRISRNPDNSYLVTFKQEYSSSNYSEKGNKELTLLKNGQNWQIIGERDL